MAEPPRRSARQLAARAEKPAPQTSGKRPSRLLNSAWTRKDTLSSRNAAESPLLRLSPEIRNQIYVYVLGGCEVHVASMDSGPRISVCRRGSVPDDTEDPSEWNYITTLRNGAWYRDELWSFVDRHMGCIWACNHVRKSLDLRMLQVCRQIHTEAALIPLMHNTFIVSGSRAMKLWQPKLIPVQLRALQSIILSFDAYEHSLPASLTNALPKLQRLGIYYECVGFYGSDPDTISRWKAAADYVQQSGGTEMSERLAAKQVKVAMIFQSKESVSSLYTEGYDTWFDIATECSDDACAAIEDKITSNY